MIESRWAARRDHLKPPNLVGLVGVGREVCYRFFYTDKSHIVFDFESDLDARKYAIADQDVYLVQHATTNRVVWRR